MYPLAPPSDDHRRKLSSDPVSIRRTIHGRHQLATPPLTPDVEAVVRDPSVKTKRESDALDFLLTIFPQDGLSALPFAKSVSISAQDMNGVFNGVVLELPGKPKTLFVDGKSAETVSLRERYGKDLLLYLSPDIAAVISIVALLDLADDNLQCAALVIALGRSSPALSDLLHSLMYVGGTVVTKPPFRVNPAFILVGMEI
jgi:hypothetical protein